MGNASRLNAEQPIIVHLREGTNGKMVQPADVNNDGAIDLIVVGEPNTIAVLYNRGEAEFAPAVYFETRNGPYAIAIADLDDDRDLDLATTGINSGVTTLRNAIGRYEGIIVSPGQVVSHLDFGNLPIVDRATVLSASTSYDVNADGTVSPQDVLMVINAMNNGRAEGEPGREAFDFSFDVSGDGLLSPRDALLIINYLNRTST
jgi:hypothetical protein